MFIHNTPKTVHPQMESYKIECMKQIILITLFLALCYPQFSYAQLVGHNTKNISYVTRSGSDKHQLDIYLPQTKPVVPHPVHIFIHGGAWNIGDKNTVKRRNAKFYNDRGIILVSANYRLSPDVKHPSHIEDVVLAVKWVKDNIEKYNGDPNNIVLSGHSAGAHLVALAGVHPLYMEQAGLNRDMFTAIIPVDTATFNLLDRKEPDNFIERTVEKMKIKAFGTDHETLKDASPLLNIEKDVKLSPIISFATETRNDAVEQVQLFSDKLAKNGHEASGVTVTGGLSHRDMAKAIFHEGNVISDAIVRYLLEKQQQEHLKP